MAAQVPTSGGHSIFEILAAVLVLGVIAALVTPQFTSASPTREVIDETPFVRDMLQRQIDLFHERNGRYPNLAEMQRRPSDTSLGDGMGVLVDHAYLAVAPVNPRTGGSGVPTDWEYDTQTGRIAPARATAGR